MAGSNEVSVDVAAGRAADAQTLVFINYRSSDAASAAAFLHAELSDRFGREAVFLDYESIPLGRNFEPELLARVRSCAVLLVVVGDRWLAGEIGQRPIDNPDDWARREIVEALGHGVPVVPVLFGGGKVDSDRLPPELVVLSNLQYFQIHRLQRSDIKALGDYLVRQVPGLDREMEVDLRASEGADNKGIGLGPLAALNGLPPDTSAFIGRDGELRVLGRERFVVVSGLAGVGKSALALHFAHNNDFPGGRLYFDLRGYDPDPTRRFTPRQALGSFLEALGSRVPPEEDQRSTLFRSLTAAREPMLIVIDNARSAQDVKPLLPVGHRVVVTSRHALIGLDDAHQLELDSLPLDEATTLVGGEELAKLCGRLPLALRIMAGLRDLDPDHDWVDELRKALLEVLDDEDGRSVRAVFDVSYHALKSDQQRFFRLITLSPTPEITVEGSALLAGVSIPKARKLLRQLRIAHLVEPGDRFHDLVHYYAAEWTSQDDERHAAMDRFIIGLSEQAWAMHEKLATPKAFEAMHWFDVHRSTLFMTALSANITFRAKQAIPLTKALVGYMRLRQDSELSTTARLAVDTAVNAKDKRAELDARLTMAYVCLDAAEDEQAAAWFHTVWERIRSSYDLPMVHRTLSGFVTALERTGRDRAAESARRDLEFVEQQLST